MFDGPRMALEDYTMTVMENISEQMGEKIEFFPTRSPRWHGRYVH